MVLALRYTVNIPILLMKKLRLKKAKQLAQGHTSGSWQIQARALKHYASGYFVSAEGC